MEREVARQGRFNSTTGTFRCAFNAVRAPITRMRFHVINPQVIAVQK